ncbi:MAG: hypothetical protein HQ589_09510 [Syntrophaceae bacterium]|nr:hypothetical protein [Syntrophaceae bacterium]
MPLIKKQRGRVTYYTAEGNKAFSSLVTENLDSGDLKIYFAGVTGSGAEDHGPGGEIPVCFERFENALKEAGICQSLSEVDFLEIHAFGAPPKSPNPFRDPLGYAEAQKKNRDAYTDAYNKYWAEHMPHNGLPVRFTVYLESLPNKKASYEVSGTAILQKKR